MMSVITFEVNPPFGVIILWSTGFKYYSQKDGKVDVILTPWPVVRK